MAFDADENNKQRQEEELFALKSIYPELIDLRDVKPNKRPSYALPEMTFAQAVMTSSSVPANRSPTTSASPRNRKKESNNRLAWRPIEICMTITSDSDEPNNSGKLDLYVKCGADYPLKKPQQVRLHNSGGLSNASMARLDKDVSEIVDECARKGEEVLFMIIGRVKEFLMENDRSTVCQSFYDQMLSNQQKQQEQMEREEQERLNIEKEKQVEMNKVRF